jgi:hypothetical protein
MRLSADRAMETPESHSAAVAERQGPVVSVSASRAEADLSTSAY